jgi:hypothetical protein
MVIAPAGTGKSAAAGAIFDAFPQDKYVFDSVTRNALRYIANDISNFNGLVVIDDLGKIDTDYSRMATVTTFAELCYSHFVKKMTMSLNIEVKDFYGSTIMNVQPVIFDNIVRGAEWEAVVRDKTIRYYHLIRPVKPQIVYPRLDVDWGIEMARVNVPNRLPSDKHPIMKIAKIMWGRARMGEHVTSILRAAASLRRDTKVKPVDAEVAARIMKPCAAERYLIGKTGFESGRYFLLNTACLLTEFTTWGIPTVDQVMEDYKVSRSTVYRIIKDMKDYCYVDKKHIYPTDLTKQILGLVK